MKIVNVLLLLLLCSFFYSTPRKAPIEYNNTIVKIVDKDFAYIKVLIHNEFEVYELSKIVFSTFVLNKSDLVSISLYKQDKYLCFDLPIQIDTYDYSNCWVYLYNKHTKRYECYKE